MTCVNEVPSLSELSHATDWSIQVHAAMSGSSYAEVLNQYDQ